MRQRLVKMVTRPVSTSSEVPKPNSSVQVSPLPRSCFAASAHRPATHRLCWHSLVPEAVLELVAPPTRGAGLVAPRTTCPVKTSQLPPTRGQASTAPYSIKKSRRGWPLVFGAEPWTSRTWWTVIDPGAASGERRPPGRSTSAQLRRRTFPWRGGPRPGLCGYQAKQGGNRSRRSSHRSPPLQQGDHRWCGDRRPSPDATPLGYRTRRTSCSASTPGAGCLVQRAARRDQGELDCAPVRH